MTTRRQSVPDPPSALSPEAQARWRDVVPGLASRGAVDVETLATYCQVWVRWRTAESDIAKVGNLVKNGRGDVVANPLLAVANQAATQVRAIEDRLGIGGASPEPAESGATLTRRELADVLGKHMMTVTKWERDGMPIAERGRKGKASRYREADVRAWLQSREDAAKKAGVVDVAQERARKERAQAVLAEQTYKARARELLPIAEVEKAWSAEVSAVRTKLLAFGQTLADQVFRVATIEGLAGVERVIQDAIREVLQELSAPSEPGKVA